MSNTLLKEMVEHTINEEDNNSQVAFHKYFTGKLQNHLGLKEEVVAEMELKVGDMIRNKDAKKVGVVKKVKDGLVTLEDDTEIDMNKLHHDPKMMDDWYVK